MFKKQGISNLKTIFFTIILALLSTGIVQAFPKTKIKSSKNRQVPVIKSTAINCPSQNSPAVLNGFADVVAPLMPAVVNISTVQKPQQSKKMLMGSKEGGSMFEELLPFFEKSFPPGMFSEEPFDSNKKLISLGSGFIIDSKGYIVTNYHVISEAAEITVKLHNGASMKAKIIGVDKATDIALLKINYKKPLAFAKFGNSDKARVGDWVVAIGNPFGLGNTVTVGVVSANGRDISSEGMVDNFIQTDAAINRGNSGGPMFNIKGEVIGINTQILSPSGVNIGIGFATPSSIIGPVIKQLKATGKVISGFLGITMQLLSEDLAEAMGLNNNKGALVIEVRKDTPAERAGILVGDIITSFNNKNVNSIREFQRIVRNSPIGKELPMTILRNKQQKELVVKLAKTQKGINLLRKFGEKFKKLPKLSSYKGVLGAGFAKLSDDLRNKFGIEGSVKGLILLEINKKSIWYSQDFMVGDVLLLVNGSPLTSVDQLEKEIKDSKNNKRKSMFFLVQKKNMRSFMSLPLE